VKDNDDANVGVVRLPTKSVSEGDRLYTVTGDRGSLRRRPWRSRNLFAQREAAAQTRHTTAPLAGIARAAAVVATTASAVVAVRGGTRSGAFGADTRAVATATADAAESVPRPPIHQCLGTLGTNETKGAAVSIISLALYYSGTTMATILEQGDFATNSHLRVPSYRGGQQFRWGRFRIAPGASR